MISALFFALLAALGAVIGAVQVILAGAVRRATGPFPASPPSRRAGSFVSILKPVCGLDDELEANLLSFVELRGVAYEVVISAEDGQDPAVEVVKRVMRAHPSAPFRLVVEAGTARGIVNRKIERLVAASRVARGDILLISDSNVRVTPDAVAQTVALFDDPAVGCVSNLFTGSGALDLGATIEALHLLSFVVTGTTMAASAGIPCVVGKSMAVRRNALDAIGGFARFRTVLAEDQAIGLAVRKAGFAVALSPVTVSNVIARRTVRRAVDRQVRWNKIRYSFSKPLYSAEILLNPLPFALLSAALAPEALWAAPLLVAAARLLQIGILNRVMRAGLSWRQIALVPLLDGLMLWAWLVPYFSNHVTWRGFSTRIGRNSEMIEMPS